MTSDQKKITAIVPAYNEEKNIADVLRVLKESRELDDIIVVDDGSVDGTGEIAKQAGVRIIRQENQGKAGAMATGAQYTDSTIILFVDADLIGLNADHVSALLHPVVSGEAGMSVGIRDRGSLGMWMMEHFLPIIGGERAVSRVVFLEIVKNNISKRFGIETLMNAYCKKHRIPVRLVRMQGVNHIIKEVRYGIWRGATARVRMAYDILATEITVMIKGH